MEMLTEITKIAWGAILDIFSDRVYVISGQPGTITYECETNFNEKNIETVIFEPEFLEAKKKILKALENK